MLAQEEGGVGLPVHAGRQYTVLQPLLSYVTNQRKYVITQSCCAASQLAPALHQLAPPGIPPPRDTSDDIKRLESLSIQQNESWFLLQTTLTTLPIRLEARSQPQETNNKRVSYDLGHT